MRRIALCADDFGGGSTIDDAIRELAERGRLDAVSCFALGPTSVANAPSLKKLRDRVDIGLHFFLSSGRFGLPSLILRSQLRLLREETVSALFEAQLDRFEALVGGPPDYVDGHEHVHAFPVVRDSVIRILKRRYPQRLPVVRNIVSLGSPSLKARALGLLGGNSLRTALGRAGIPHNSDLAGLYDFSAKMPYRDFFRSFLGEARDGAILVCHPGKKPGQSGDRIAAARLNEHVYLSSAEFERDLEEAKVRRVRLTALVG